MKISLLEKAGLTDGEIRVYLALLETGTSKAGPIIKKSKVAKSIFYQIIEKLIQKGLASYIIKEKTKHFQAAEPDKIIHFIEEKEKELEKTRAKIEKELLPQLLTRKGKNNSEATIFLGSKGIQSAHEKTYKELKKGEEYCFLGIPANQPEHMHAYWKKDHKKRVKAGILCKLLFNKDTDLKIVQNRNKFKGCTARLMNTKIKTPASFLTYKDTTVIILQSSTPLAIEIKNQEIKDSFQAYFDEFWKKSKI